MGRFTEGGFLLLLVVLFSNCRQKEFDPSVIINVEDDFYIDMFEDISNGENIFNLTIKSIKDQFCLNSEIDYTLEMVEEEDFISVSINDILQPETCIPGNAPASISIPLPNLKEQSYVIQIKLKDVIFNSGNLIVNSSDYFLKMNTDNGFELVHNTLYKIPKKTIWGYVGFEDESYETVAESFIKDLDDLATDIGTAGGYDIGYFGYFTILGDRSITLKEEIEDKLHNTFIFSFDGNSQEIIDLIDEYCNSNPELNFNVFNGEGEEMTCQ
jgi:hypothetical protein